MFVLATVSMATYAQSLKVTGKVIDSEGFLLRRNDYARSESEQPKCDQCHPAS